MIGVVPALEAGSPRSPVDARPSASRESFVPSPPLVREDTRGNVILLDDGRQLVIRPMRTDDTKALQAMHRKLSKRSQYQRFFGFLPELSLAQAERFTHVDGRNRVALVAVTGEGELVAVARYDRLPPDGRLAEAAFVVADPYQHHKLGTALVRLLASHARANQVDSLIADVLTTNTAMLHTFVETGLLAEITRQDGIAHLVMSLGLPSYPLSSLGK